MAVLFNKSTGLAEDVQDHQSALDQGTHEVPLYSPEGAVGSASAADAPGLLAQGFTQPTDVQRTSLLKQGKFGTTKEQLKTAAEGAIDANTLGLAGGLENMLGSDPEARQTRREVNPGVYAAGQVAGLGASMFTGMGEGALIEHAGQAVSSLLPQGTSLAAKAGRAIVKQGAEMAIMQMGDENVKLIASDPGTTAETYLSNVGLAAALGGAFGAGSAGAKALWEIGPGKQLGTLLNTVRNRADTEAGKQSISALASQAGLDLSPELKASMATDANGHMASSLLDSQTGGAKAFQKSRDKAFQDMSDASLNALGRTADDLGKGMSQYEAGDAVKDHLSKELKAKIDPVSAGFDKIQEKFSTTPLSEDFKTKLNDELSNLSLKEGYGLDESDPIGKAIRDATKTNSKLSTLEDLRKYQSRIAERFQAEGHYDAAKKVRAVYRGIEQDALQATVGQEAPELLDTLKQARAGYSDLMGKIDDLNDRLHVGRYGGPDSFIKALQDMPAERAVTRLLGTKDAGLLSTLQEHYPETAELIKNHHITTALDKAASKADEGIHVGELLKQVDKWSPELRQFTLNDSQSQALDAMGELLKKMPEKKNFSGTAGVLDQMNKFGLGGLGMVMGMVSGHGVAGTVLGHAARLLGRELPDRGKLAMLKMLGSDNEVSAQGFKAAAEAVGHMIKGEKALDKAAKAVFQGGEVISLSVMPNAKDTEKLQKALKVAQLNPEHVMDGAGDLGYYMPEHAAAMGVALTSANNYLSSLRPDTTPKSPFDPPRQPSDIELVAYHRQLHIAANPILVMKHVQEGSLIPQDLATVRAIYPNYLNHVTQKLVSQAADTIQEGSPIPLSIEQSMGMLLGQPVGSATMPQNIMSNALVGVRMPANPPSAKTGAKTMSKTVSMNQTPEQSRLSQKGS